ncbi:MAG: hypothetical protein FWB86_14850 [Treponema sp.]|nr:hypothetical protein [Treponema sp.]MCL2252794.1 hypothetical protein [Treponema sp.]
MICSKNHRFLPIWEQLPFAQDDVQNDRHRCAGCAYLEGLKDALNGMRLADALNQDIPQSQAGTVRHKDAYSAYQMGYQYGITINT